MPDSSLGLRPVVRRSSAIHSDLLSRFEGRRPSTSSITSSGTPSGVTSPSSSISSTATPYTLERTKSILEKSEKSIKTRTGSVKTKVSRTKAEVSFLMKSLNQKLLSKTITKIGLLRSKEIYIFFMGHVCCIKKTYRKICCVLSLRFGSAFVSSE